MDSKPRHGIRVVFINYRSADTGLTAQRLADDLSARLPRDRVHETQPDFRLRIGQWRDQVHHADVVLVLIGRSWLKSHDGTKGLDEPTDPVREELEVALERRGKESVKVVPVLVDDAPMPSEPALPRSVAMLASLQPYRLRNSNDWAHDVDDLLTFLATAGFEVPRGSPWEVVGAIWQRFLGWLAVQQAEEKLRAAARRHALRQGPEWMLSHVHDHRRAVTWIAAVATGASALAVAASLLWHLLPLQRLGVSRHQIDFALSTSELHWLLAGLGAQGREVLTSSLAFELVLAAAYGVALPLGILLFASRRRDGLRTFGAVLGIACVLAPLLDVVANHLLRRELTTFVTETGASAGVGAGGVPWIAVTAIVRWSLLVAGVAYVSWCLIAQLPRVDRSVRALMGHARHRASMLGAGAVGLAAAGALSWLALGGSGLSAAVVVVLLVGVILPLGLAWRPAWEAVDSVRRPEHERPLDPFTMVPIPAGRFRLGSPRDERDRYDNEGPIDDVAVASFAIKQSLVTRGEWRQVMPVERWPTQWADGDGHDALPATHVTWIDAVDFCNSLSDRDGRRRAYVGNWDAKAKLLRGVHWDRSADGYRLPTEAEWEYAARAGTTTRYPWGDDERGLDAHAWWWGNTRVNPGPRPVGTKQPNGFGLYDMIGNVWEWCWDVFDQTAQPEGRDEPLAGRRLVRGGSVFVFGPGPRFLRSACRSDRRPSDQGVALGFRCVRTPLRQHAGTSAP